MKKLESAPSTIDFHAMTKAQPDATDLQHLHSANNTFKFTKVSMPMCGDTLICDITTGTLRPISQSSSDVQCSIHSTGCHTQVSKPHYD